MPLSKQAVVPSPSGVCREREGDESGAFAIICQHNQSSLPDNIQQILRSNKETLLQSCTVTCTPSKRVMHLWFLIIVNVFSRYPPQLIKALLKSQELSVLMAKFLATNVVSVLNILVARPDELDNER